MNSSDSSARHARLLSSHGDIDCGDSSASYASRRWCLRLFAATVKRRRRDYAVATASEPNRALEERHRAGKEYAQPAENEERTFGAPSSAKTAPAWVDDMPKKFATKAERPGTMPTNTVSAIKNGH